VGKFQTTYLQVSVLRALWTILGILALAFLMTPRFDPFGAEGSTEISQTVSDFPAAGKSNKSAVKRTENSSIFGRIQKFLQVRSNTEHSRTPAKRM
jgi:hypothetical protein